MRPTLRRPSVSPIVSSLALTAALVTTVAAPAFAASGQSKDKSGAQIEYSAAADSVYRATHLDMAGN